MKNSKLYVCALALCASISISQASAAQLKGVVVDPANNPIAGAQVAAVNQLGVIAQQVTDDKGLFDFNVSPLYENVQVRATAPGFQTVTVAPGTQAIRLAIASQNDSVSVVGSALNSAISEYGSSATVITSGEIRERNEALAVNLLRGVPGFVISQNGPRGALADLFVRGGDPKYNLVLVNGIPATSFYYGGLFDFAHVAAESIEQIDIVRGPQSAVHGSYAIGSVVSFTTRSPESGPAFDITAEGGTHAENRFSVGGSGMLGRGWGLAGSFSSLNGNGPVINNDYRNDDALLSLQHRWGAQSLYVFGNFNSNELGQPGAYGSNPLGYFSGLDTISRSKNNGSSYGGHYSADVTSRLRLDATAGFHWNNGFYASQYGTSFAKELNGFADARATVRVNQHLTSAWGYTFEREQVRNSYITVTSGQDFLLRRDDQGVYEENRIVLGRLFINAGLRFETYRTPLVPGNAFGFPARPDFPARVDTRVNPKLSASYALATSRLHASWGTGIRPPGGSDLAFTNNPALLTEKVQSYDLGVEQHFGNKLSVDATWFHNRYSRLIVSLGGSLAKLSAFSTDNVANAKAEGMEFSATVRPARWMSLNGNWTWLQTQVLSLDGGNGLVQAYYYPGQPLLRRPKQSGGINAGFHFGRVDLNMLASLRGHSLDVEANYGAFGGLYWNPGYQSVGVNLNVRVANHVTMYANVSNAFNQHYEEIYGYPAPLAGVVAGIKWNLARAR